VQALKQAVSAENHETAERLVHSTKGVAGNMGATVLQNCAEQLERSIREKAKPPEIARLLTDFSRELTDLLVQIQRALPSEAPLVPQNSFDKAKLAEVLIQLGGFLASDKPEACELFESHGGLLQQSLSESGFASLSQHIGQYDFPEAREVLVAEAARLGISLPSSEA